MTLGFLHEKGSVSTDQRKHKGVTLNHPLHTNNTATGYLCIIQARRQSTTSLLRQTTYKNAALFTNPNAQKKQTANVTYTNKTLTNVTLLWSAKNTKWPFRPNCLHVLKDYQRTPSVLWIANAHNKIISNIGVCENHCCLRAQHLAYCFSH